MEASVGSFGTKEQNWISVKEVCYLISHEVQRQDGVQDSFNDSTPTSRTWLFASSFLGEAALPAGRSLHVNKMAATAPGPSRCNNDKEGKKLSFPGSPLEEPEPFPESSQKASDIPFLRIRFYVHLQTIHSLGK